MSSCCPPVFNCFKHNGINWPLSKCATTMAMRSTKRPTHENSYACVFVKVPFSAWFERKPTPSSLTGAYTCRPVGPSARWPVARPAALISGCCSCTKPRALALGLPSNVDGQIPFAPGMNETLLDRLPTGAGVCLSTPLFGWH